MRDWNLNALNALVKPTDAPEPGAGQTPPVTLLHMAMVHGAIYDAVNAIDGGYQSYLPDVGPASPSASVDAAVATAAHDVLVGLTIGPTVAGGGGDEARWSVRGGVGSDPRRRRQDRRHRRRGRRRGGDAGGESRRRSLRAVLAPRRRSTRRVASRPRPTRSATRSPGSPTSSRSWSTARHSSARLGRTRSTAPSTPPSTTRSRTSAASTARADPEQQALADFYNVHASELFNRTLRTVAEAEGLSVADEARLFAMANLIGADTIITCWGEKAYWHFWRPITAIHEGDNDGNDDTVGDPTWEPMLPTPPYPDHASGFNCVSSAFMYGADAFFGGEPIAFSVVRIAPDVPDVTRDYERFTDVVDDTIDARVFQGLHFRAADVQGAEIGANVAEWVATNHFQPAGAAPTSTT